MSDDAAGSALAEALQRARSLDTSLDGRLKFYADECRRLAPSCADAWERLIDRLADHRTGMTTPRPGDLLPGFVLSDECGLWIALDELLKAGPLAVTFHPGHWCPFSRLSSDALGEAQARAEATGGRIVAITPDRQRYAANLRKESGGRVRVLTDPHNSYAFTLGIAVWVGLEIQKILSERAMKLPSFQGNGAWLIPLPATFVVEAGGRVVARHVPHDFRTRMAVRDLLNSLEAAATHSTRVL